MSKSASHGSTRSEAPLHAEPWDYRMKGRVPVLEELTLWHTQRRGRYGPSSRSRHMLSEGDQVLREHRPSHLHGFQNSPGLRWVPGRSWLREASQRGPSTEETLHKALYVPLRCHRERSCARGAPRPKRQGLHRSRSKPVRGDQGHPLHSSFLQNPAPQHLGGSRSRPAFCRHGQDDGLGL